MCWGVSISPLYSFEGFPRKSSPNRQMARAQRSQSPHIRNKRVPESRTLPHTHGRTDISAQGGQAPLLVKLSCTICGCRQPRVGKKNTLICCTCQELKPVRFTLQVVNQCISPRRMRPTTRAPTSPVLSRSQLQLSYVPSNRGT